ncbi:MAG: peptidase M15 [Acidobacteria bacterium]|nr:MAG: peptidase M15 [Acidobacteriota bacterium]
MLSEHFSVEELTASEVAARAGIDNTPSLRNAIHVTNGYRSPRLNQMVGGSKNSMHIEGLAADIICAAFGPPLGVCRAIATSGIPADQIIHEFSRWCHVGFAPEGHAARNELLTIANAVTGFQPGLRSV